MNGKYNTLLNKLNEIINNKASSFESSLLYQNEVINFLKDVNNLNAKYSNILANIFNLKNSHSESSYQKIFSLTNSTISKFNKLSDDLTIIKTKIINSSNDTYTEFDFNFQLASNTAKNLLSTAKNHIDSYNRLNYEIRNLKIDDPNYSSKLSSRRNHLSQAENNLNSASRTISNLEELLNKGLKKV